MKKSILAILLFLGANTAFAESYCVCKISNFDGPQNIEVTGRGACPKKGTLIQQDPPYGRRGRIVSCAGPFAYGDDRTQDVILSE